MTSRYVYMYISSLERKALLYKLVAKMYMMADVYKTGDGYV